MKLKERNIEE